MADKEDIIPELGQTEYFNYVGDSTGYGVWGHLYRVSGEGVMWCGAITEHLVYECTIFTEEEYHEARLRIENGTDDELDPDLVEMTKAGCEPGEQYWVPADAFRFGNDPEYYASYDEAFQAATDAMDGEFTPWEEMDEDELADWLEIVRQHGKGI